MIKVSEDLWIQGTHLNIIRTIHSNPTTSILLNREKPQSISTKIGNKTRQSSLFPVLFNIVLEVLTLAEGDEHGTK